MPLDVVRTTDECRRWTEGARLAGRILALILTMEYLHQGHLALIAEGRPRAYLTPEERTRALSLSRGLRAARELARQGVTDVRELTNAVRSELDASKVRPDYVEVVDATSLEPLSRYQPDRPARALVAGYV